ncbi:MAG: hypothetical protein LUC91_04225, partial [Prevotella sp.]|nr:hypothetical protein [Prevotella sp.]
LNNLKQIFDCIVKLPRIKDYHKNFYSTLCKCFVIAEDNNITMFEAMKILKARIRHQGRKIYGRCIGSTLLTKGLEFDTVIVLDADKFEDEKNFYVAISRACKNLIIITDSTHLRFTPPQKMTILKYS